MELMKRIYSMNTKSEIIAYIVIAGFILYPILYFTFKLPGALLLIGGYCLYIMAAVALLNWFSANKK